MKRLFAIVWLGAWVCAASAETPTAIEILERIDRNYQAENRRAVSTMVVEGRRGTRTMTARTWVEGTERSFTEYLSPAREKGTKMLKLGDELWTWSPATDRTIRIAGHMLRQSLMGSDLSYEDFMEDPVLSNLYDAKLVGEEDVDGRPCYVLDLTAKVAEVAYHSRKLWVDRDRYLPLREERYAKSGRLLKAVHIHEVFQQDDRWYPKRITFRDMLGKGAGTELVLDSVEFDVEVPAHVFTKASLRR